MKENRIKFGEYLLPDNESILYFDNIEEMSKGLHVSKDLYVQSKNISSRERVSTEISMYVFNDFNNKQVYTVQANGLLFEGKHYSNAIFVCDSLKEAIIAGEYLLEKEIELHVQSGDTVLFESRDWLPSPKYLPKKKK